VVGKRSVGSGVAGWIVFVLSTWMLRLGGNILMREYCSLRTRRSLGPNEI